MPSTFCIVLLNWVIFSFPFCPRSRVATATRPCLSARGLNSRPASSQNGGRRAVPSSEREDTWLVILAVISSGFYSILLHSFTFLQREMTNTRNTFPSKMLHLGLERTSDKFRKRITDMVRMCQPLWSLRPYARPPGDAPRGLTVPLRTHEHVGTSGAAAGPLGAHSPTAAEHHPLLPMTGRGAYFTCPPRPWRRAG